MPLAVAVIVALALVATAVVVTVNVAVVAPAATVTEAGTVAEPLLLERLTESPPVGAALEIVTVPVEELPPATEVGLRLRAVTVGAVIERVAVAEVLFTVAVIVALVLDATAVVVIVKVAVVPPAATVTEAGTVAEALLLERLTESPPVGAGLEIVMVPVEELPPATDVGLTVSEDGVGAVTVSVAVLDVLLAVAVMVALALDATAVVVIVNVAVVPPAATVTEAGTVADPLLLERLTESPPVGAGLEMVTVPVEEFPPTTDVGLTVNDDGVGAVTVKVAVCDVLFSVAVIVALALAATATVVAVNVAVVAPAATVTEAGTVAELLLLERLTESPPVGAAWEIVTVPVEEAPPTTEVGLIATEETVGAVTVNVAVWDVLLAVAVIVELVLEATATVVAVNVAVVAPDATVTELGTVTEGLLLDRIT